MRPWIKRTLYGLFGASILVGGLSACSHHRHDYGVGMSETERAEFRGKMIARVASKLDLNAEQKQRLDVLADKLQQQRAALVGKAIDPRAELQALVAGDKFDRTRAQTLVTEKTAALNSKSPEVITAMADFFDSLTPVQQTKVREAMQGRHHWWHRG
ncbi:MAG: Spy/CpxP family protein refolding chaperone [Burkholderiales bacterium]|nr:Spy/CpxP family protein refolding chaperone [Burkholderiales bacterium]